MAGSLPVGAGDSALESTRLEADPGGAIAEWILFLGDGCLDSFVETQARIIRSADPGSRIRVLHHSREAREALEETLCSSDPGASRNVRYVQTKQEVPFWSRDLFATGRRNDGSPVFFVAAASHFLDLAAGIESTGAALLGAIEDLVGTDGISMEVLFEGGAMVSDADRVFLSPAVLEKTLLAGLGDSPASKLSAIEKLFGRATLMLDSSLTALPDHIDLFLTPIGGGRMMLGDPVLGRNLLRSLDDRSRASFQRKLSEVAGRAGNSDPSKRVLRPEFFSDLLQANGDAEFLMAFRRVEAQLERLGYEVIRVPFLWCPRIREAERLMLSYNNVVLEDRDTGKVVMMPVYGLGAVDKAAMAVWTKAGFKVKPIPCLGPAFFGGGVRCLTQVVRR